MLCYFPEKQRKYFWVIPLADGVILWQSYLDTCGDSRMLKPINMISNAVRAKARRSTCSVNPLGAILVASLMTLSAPVAAQDFQKGYTA